MEKLRFHLLSRASVPFLDALDGPRFREWIPMFLKWEELAPAVKEAERELRAVELAPISREELLQKLKHFHNAYEQRRIETLGKHIEQVRDPGCQIDPFAGVNSFLGAMGALTDLLMPRIDWQDITKAVGALPPGLAPKDREKQTAKLSERVAKLRADLAALQPPGRYLWTRANPIVDAWETFVKHWRSVQEKVDAPCCPRGAELKSCDEDERWAWQQLVGPGYVSPTVRLCPWHERTFAP